MDSVRQIRISFKTHNWDHILDSLFINTGEEGRLMGDVMIDGHVIHNIGVRYKGFSSWEADQKKSPFNIDLEYSVNNQNHMGYTKIKLSNVIHDPSFVREVLAYNIAQKYMPSSLANFAELFVNDTLVGLYTNVESVDKEFVNKHFGSKNNSFFKGSPEKLLYPFGQNSNLAYTHGSDTSGYLPYYSIESDAGWSDLLKLIYILNNDTSEINQILNVDQTLWMHAFNYTLLNLDSYLGYSQNYYLYMDNNGRFNPILWDMNMSFGSFRNSDGTTLNISIPKMKQLDPLKYLSSPTFSPRPLVKNLLVNDTYKRMYLAHMRTIINENFRNNEYFILGQHLQNIIDKYVRLDSNKFYSYNDFINNLTINTGTTADEYPGIKELVVARVAYLDTFPGFSGAPLISNIVHIPDKPEKGADIMFTSKVLSAGNVILAYRFSTNGIFTKIPMFDDGNHFDSLVGDHIYGSKISSSGHIIQYFLYAENDSAGMFSPERAEREFYTIQPLIDKGDIVLNELMPVNISIPDHDNEYDSWIELCNNTSENLSTKGIFLSDDAKNIANWALPDTVIKAKNFLIIWADNDLYQKGLHANFILSNDGGKLYLSNTLHIIDSVTYGMAVPDKSFGRFPNGIGAFTYMLSSFANYNYYGSTSQSDFVLYPNPANDKLYIELKNVIDPLSVELYNSSGQLISTRKLEGGKYMESAFAEEFNLKGFDNGINFIRIICQDQVMTRKFIIYNLLN
jgi:hypothetical protein